MIFEFSFLGLMNLMKSYQYILNDWMAGKYSITNTRLPAYNWENLHFTCHVFSYKYVYFLSLFHLYLFYFILLHTAQIISSNSVNSTKILKREHSIDRFCQRVAYRSTSRKDQVATFCFRFLLISRQFGTDVSYGSFKRQRDR